MTAARSWLPPAIAGTVRIIGKTWRVENHVPVALRPGRRERSSRYLYSVWHHTLVVQAYLHRDQGTCVGVSEHEDGELGAGAAERLGFRVVRGSTTRGALRLLRDYLRYAGEEQGDIAVAADGPRGPPRICKPGVVFLAARLGWPIVPMAAWARPAKRIRSWDRLLLPAPFARIVAVAGEPFEVQRGASRAQLEASRMALDAKMVEAHRRAEELLSR